MPDFLVAEFLLQMLSLSQFCEKYVFFYDLLLSILDAQMDFQLLVKILPMHQPVCPAQLAHIVPKLNFVCPGYSRHGKLQNLFCTENILQVFHYKKIPVLADGQSGSQLDDLKESPSFGESSHVMFSRMARYSSVDILLIFRTAAKS